VEATQALWHIAAFLVPPLFLGGVSAVTVRVLWHRELARRSFWRLWAAASTATTVASLAGLIASGHDGSVASYAAMVFASALALWWTGFRHSGR
jgi:hypothetical protein